MNKILSRILTASKKNRPEILLVIGAVGLLTTTVLAVKATPKAVKLVEEKRKELGKIKLTAAEVVKTTWKCYIPSVCTCVPSILCMIGSGSQSVKRSAALTAAYSISESAFAEYRNKVIKTIGEKKELSVKDEIAKDKLDTCVAKGMDVIVTGKGKTKCFEVLTGRLFDSDIDVIKRAEEKLNHRMREEMFIPLNDFFYEIGLAPTKLGDLLGWDIDNGYVELNFSSQLTADNIPFLVIDYSVAPRYYR